MSYVLHKMLRAAGCAGLLLAVAVSAAPAAPANIRVEHAWIRWLPANLPAAGYATIINDGDGVQRLAGASSADYGSAMLHHSRLAQGDSTMEMIDHLDIPAHGSVKLAPGGYHLMLMHPKHPVKPGDKVPVTLRFADGTTLQVDFSVRPANASGP
ncbi:MAG TPA: copper chaperone PCu(A)C [Rhodanobacteraceae bacterium]|jgi:copper(I)-binding protein|nr:copper chaperone PCu(A)C [Rhodanobacteraceae bacterium]